jgi:hypothetical protein
VGKSESDESGVVDLLSDGGIARPPRWQFQREAIEKSAAFAEKYAAKQKARNTARASGNATGRLPSRSLSQRAWDEAKRFGARDAASCAEMLEALPDAPGLVAKSDMRAVVAKLEHIARCLEEVCGE